MINYSSIKNLLVSEKEFLFGEKIKETDDIILGRAIHCAILEPEKLKERFQFIDLDMRKTDHKNLAKEFEEKNITVLKHKNLEIIENIMKNLDTSKLFKTLISYPDKSVEKKLHGIIDGVEFYGTPDFVCENLILDIKTTQDCHFDDFKWTVKNYHYDLQAAIYQQLVFLNTGKTLPFVILAIDKKAPYHFNFFKLTDETLMFGQQKLNKCIEIYKNLQAKNFENPNGYEFENCIGEI